MKPGTAEDFEIVHFLSTHFIRLNIDIHQFQTNFNPHIQQKEYNHSQSGDLSR